MFRNTTYCFPAKLGINPAPPPLGKVIPIIFADTTTTRPMPPAQRHAEVLGTPMHAQLTVPPNSLHYAPSIGIGSGQRQLIAVTCIAEHA